jgi:hypothetical protein
MQISRCLWASNPECDTHICLNLGLTSQNFRLSQVSLRVCYFWLSSFQMDEGSLLPSEHGLYCNSLKGDEKAPTLSLHFGTSII